LPFQKGFLLSTKKRNALLSGEKISVCVPKKKAISERAAKRRSRSSEQEHASFTLPKGRCGRAAAMRGWIFKKRPPLGDNSRTVRRTRVPEASLF